MPNKGAQCSRRKRQLQRGCMVAQRICIEPIHIPHTSFLTPSVSTTEGVRKEVPESMMFADDMVLCGGREIYMTEYLDTWRTSLEERGMRISRPKTQLWISFLSRINKETESP